MSYIYVQYSNLYLLAVAKNNINVGSILLFLHKLKEIFTHYFQELEEESLRDNFVIAYELLDEVRGSSLSVNNALLQSHIMHKSSLQCCSSCNKEICSLQVMDFGYPQFTEAKILSEYIKTDAHKMEVTHSTLAPFTSQSLAQCMHVSMPCCSCSRVSR